jgi:hypothetical protein
MLVDVVVTDLHMRGTRVSSGPGLNLSHLPREIVFAHDMASNSAVIPPLFKADAATLTFSASKDGKIRVTQNG